jgi:Brp/Blh family beta-carotene 15,15'-monooxygenase
MTMSPIWQTWLFAITATASIAVMTVLQPNLTVQILLLVPFVAIFGLPHGALDLPIAQAIWPLNGWQGTAYFVALYLGLAGAVILAWTYFPGFSLFAFLIYSAIHFAGDWEDAPVILRWTGGAATIGAPSLFHRDEVATIFGYLAPMPPATLAATVLACVGAVALVATLIIVVSQPAVRTRAVLEQIVLWVAALCLSPLIYFIVYFCALHSVRHMTLTLNWIDDRRTAVHLSIALSVVTVLTGFASIGIIQGVGLETIENAISKTVFIGLAALTVPHLILVDQFRHSAATSTLRQFKNTS